MVNLLEEMGIQPTELEISAIRMLHPTRHEDCRGFFSETYSRFDFKEIGIDVEFVQDNQSYSSRKGTVRGLHFQRPPHAQAKLVRVVRGSIFDVAVDLRRSSPTYGRHVCAAISSRDWNQIYVPVGFAHGFMTLEPETEVVYKVDKVYEPCSEGGLLWNDECLGISWPFPEADVTVSERDKSLPSLGELESPFD